MSIGIWQVVLILMIVLILFGAGKLPKVMGDVAKGVKNFKAGLRDDDGDGAEVTAAAPAASPAPPPPLTAPQQRAGTAADAPASAAGTGTDQR